ncbi:MAG: UDP-N-acetylmuramoyl-L-alanyl-D-glutamate--2,6-diaminopimelate ligase [Bacteroidetes bacterium]|nr:UDP-N-acetylmuramoyl-L-alanyl-D-glutamate--2,6-diaminopimelate ligase [Bacteroidota bacterium]
MTTLTTILNHVKVDQIEGDMHKNIGHLSFDSRKVKIDSLFVAISGTQVDGHDYIGQALEQGAVAIVCEKFPENIQEGITYLLVENSARALGIMASNFMESPSSKLALVGITGTNGKTTTVTVLFQLFKDLGYKSGLISTIENRINDKVLPASHTTPDAIQLNEILHEMVGEGCSHCFMEVSSHALDQERIGGLTFTGAVFTNISHDHLDYHLTFEQYIMAKKKLFNDLPSHSFALVNSDDKRAAIMVQNTKANKKTYALKKIADFQARIITNSIQGMELQIENKPVWFKLIGEFNAYNILAAYAIAKLLGEDGDKVLTGLSNVDNVPGRFQQVTGPNEVTAFVDYAHTPDALKNVLKTLKSILSRGENIITVVGCGGNRDKAKRPIMADIACKNSDKVILTSDNPRDESPEAIISDMKKGVQPADNKKILAITDRREAIKTACNLAGNHDIILVAGKGHEKYQEIQGVKYPFDDREVVNEMLNMINS